MPKTSISALAGVALTLVALSGCGSSLELQLDGAAATTSEDAKAAFIVPLNTFSTVGSTVPANGDVNPYGIAFVPTSVGKLKRARCWSAISTPRKAPKRAVRAPARPSCKSRVPARPACSRRSTRTLPGPCPGGVGLTTALNILPGGYVIVGSLPTTNGKSATAKYGCLIVLNSEGKWSKRSRARTFRAPGIRQPRAKARRPRLFVSNALNGGAAKGEKVINNSTVLRIDLESGEGQSPKVLSEQIIGEGIPWVNSPEALVLGPTGLALAANGTLYVASTQDNKILAISEAATRTTAAAGGGTVISEGGHLKEPLGLVLAPNGNIITSNGGDGNMVETTPKASKSPCRAPTRKRAPAHYSASRSARARTASTTWTTAKTQ